MKKIVMKLDLHDDKAKQKALKTASTLSGIDSIAMDMKEMKMTVIGTVDPVTVVSKLRKHWPTTAIISVGPAKEPEKKEEPKKEGEQPKKEDEAKKEEQPKKDEQPKKEEEKKGDKKEEEKKKEPAQQPQPHPNPHPQPLPLPPPDPVLELVKAYRAYNPHLTSYYYVQSMEENPNACVVC